MMSALLFHCFEMCDLPFSPNLFYFIWISPFRKKNLIDFCSPLKYIYIYIFFLKFEIWNLEFETFFLKKDTLCSWSSLKAYFSSFKIEFFLKLMSSIFEIFFYSSLFIFLSFKRTKQKFYLFFFLGVDWVNSVKPELTQQPRWNKRGGGANFLAPHLLHLHLFILLLPPHSSLFLHCHYSHTSSTCIFFLLTQFLL